KKKKQLTAKSSTQQLFPNWVSSRKLRKAKKPTKAPKGESISGKRNKPTYFERESHHFS
ncbi:unnamed protein product, partial [Prunus brigantina]